MTDLARRESARLWARMRVCFSNGQFTAALQAATLGFELTDLADFQQSQSDGRVRILGSHEMPAGVALLVPYWGREPTQHDPGARFGHVVVNDRVWDEQVARMPVWSFARRVLTQPDAAFASYEEQSWLTDAMLRRIEVTGSAISLADLRFEPRTYRG